MEDSQSPKNSAKSVQQVDTMISPLEIDELREKILLELVIQKKQVRNENENSHRDYSDSAFGEDGYSHFEINPAVWPLLRTSRSWRTQALGIMNRLGQPLFNFNLISDLKRYSFQLKKLKKFLNTAESYDMPPFSLTSDTRSLTDNAFLFNSTRCIPAMICFSIRLREAKKRVGSSAIRSICCQLPILRRLEITLQSDEIQPEFRDLIQRIFNGSPSLDQVAIHREVYVVRVNYDIPEFTNFIHWQLPQTVTYFNGKNLRAAALKDLLLRSNGSDSRSAPKPRLKVLRLHNSGRSKIAEEIFEVLNQFGDTLEEVELSGYEFTAEYPTRFPKMNKLRWLMICTDCCSPIEIPNVQQKNLGANLKNLQFISLPNINSFLLAWLKGNVGNGCEKFEAVSKLETSLCLRGADERGTLGAHVIMDPLWTISTIHHGFPNIRHLSVNMIHSDSPLCQIRYIFSHFRQLSSLNLHWQVGPSMFEVEDEVDALLIGCPVDLIAQLRVGYGTCIERLHSNYLNNESEEEYPSIRLLHQLTTLKFAVNYNDFIWPPVHPSDLSFQYGFLRMPNLKELQFLSDKFSSRMLSSEMLDRWAQEKGSPVVFLASSPFRPH